MNMFLSWACSNHVDACLGHEQACPHHGMFMSLFWSWVGMLRACSGHVLVVNRSCSGRVQIMFWSWTGHVLVMLSHVKATAYVSWYEASLSCLCLCIQKWFLYCRGALGGALAGLSTSWASLLYCTLMGAFWWDPWLDWALVKRLYFIAHWWLLSGGGPGWIGALTVSLSLKHADLYLHRLLLRLTTWVCLHTAGCFFVGALAGLSTSCQPLLYARYYLSAQTVNLYLMHANICLHILSFFDARWSLSAQTSTLTCNSLMHADLCQHRLLL
jgi:hypothetical protein